MHTAEIQGQPAELNTLGRFGTSFYILAAIFFTARAGLLRPDLSFWTGLKKRARRLLIPYVLWCAIYAAFYFCNHVAARPSDFGNHPLLGAIFWNSATSMVFAICVSRGDAGDTVDSSLTQASQLGARWRRSDCNPCQLRLRLRLGLRRA